MTLATRNRCPLQGKLKYRSRLDALIDTMRRGGYVRAYRCQECGMWHTTKQPRKGDGSC